MQHAGADDATGPAGTVNDDCRVLVQVFGDVGNAQGQLATGHASAAGDAEPLVLLWGPCVQDNQLIAALDAFVQFGCFDLRDVMLNLHPFPEVLADHVAAPLGGKALGRPLVDAMVQDRNVVEAHTF